MRNTCACLPAPTAVRVMDGIRKVRVCPYLAGISSRACSHMHTPLVSLQETWIAEKYMSAEVVEDYEGGLEYAEAECVLGVKVRGDSRTYRVRCAYSGSWAWALAGSAQLAKVAGGPALAVLGGEELGVCLRDMEGWACLRGLTQQLLPTLSSPLALPAVMPAAPQQARISSPGLTRCRVHACVACAGGKTATLTPGSLRSM